MDIDPYFSDSLDSVYVPSGQLNLLADDSSVDSLDIDGNGEYDALTDGLLLLRGMFGLTGSALVSNAVATDANYIDAAEIQARIESLSNIVDIDADGQVDALTDGLIILRYLLGLRGDVLLNGVVSNDADRDTATAIEAYVESLLPEIEDNSDLEIIYVRLNDQPFTAPYYLFSATENGAAQTITLDKGASYKFVRTDSGHPFNLGAGWRESLVGFEISSTSSTNLVSDLGSIEDGQSITLTIPPDFAATTITYYCYTHFSMKATLAISGNTSNVAPVFSSLALFSAAENQTSIGSVSATDGDSLSISFSISEGDLEITSAGVLSFMVAPDYEVSAAYTATVTATDGANETSQLITVTVTDVDDEAPEFTSLAAFSAAENQTTIGIVSATDADSDNASLRFTVSGSDLTIDTVSGVLSFVSAPDYEAITSYTATVTASDGTNSTTQAVFVSITDVDEYTPPVNTSGAFELLGNTVTLEDYNPASQTIITNQFDLDFVDGIASADLRSAPLNLTNIKNGTTSPVGDYSDTLLRFDLNNALPLGNGTGIVDLYVTTGSDGVRASSESQLHCQLQITWSSDGASASILEPPQDISLKIYRPGGTIITVTINEFDIMTVAVDELTGVKTLEIKLLSALSEGVRVGGGLLNSLLVPRTLHIKVATTLLINDSEGAVVSEFDSVIRLDN